MTGRSASCRSSTTAPSNGSPTRSWTTTRPTRTSRRSSAASTRPSCAGVDPQRDHDRWLGAYPEPIAEVFGEIPHQVCTFHILREVTKAVFSAVAQERKELAAAAPKLPRGRPRATEAARRAALRKKRIKRKVSDLFENRYLFVQRRLSPSERATLQRVSRGLPQLRVLRELMAEVYRLFDRRCRTATAMAKLTALRDRLRRSGRLRAVLKKLLSPGLEKALVFLDERLIGATSNAVERGNRRYRKMQKTVYRVRTGRAIERRLALDLIRESQAQGRDGTTKILHKARAA